jgi:hypothetical protein
MQRRPIFILVGILAAAAVLADGAWTWTDEDGVVHYSDVPVEGAEPVNLSEYNKKTGARISSGRTTGSTTSNGPEESFVYDSITIASPGAEETLWNIEGLLNVSVAVSPELQRGHRIRAYYDGDARDVGGTSFQILDVYRGTHSLQAEIVDSTGRVILRSPASRFYVQQNSIR